MLDLAPGGDDSVGTGSDSGSGSTEPGGSKLDRRRLCELLSESRSALDLHQRALRRARGEHEAQLASLCGQMMSLECGLRRKERELTAALRQRDRVIKEQECIIKFLFEKTGCARGGKRSIANLEDQALAKIPQIVEAEQEEEEKEEGGNSRASAATLAASATLTCAPKNVIRIRLGGPPSSLVEVGDKSDRSPFCDAHDDSDSAIIPDCFSSSLSASHSTSSSRSSSDVVVSPSNSTAADFSGVARLRRISRSVSDVVTAATTEAEADDEVSCDTLESSGSSVRSKSEEIGALLSYVGRIAEEAEGEEEEEEDGEVSTASSFSEYLPGACDQIHLAASLHRRGSYERYRCREKTRNSCELHLASGVRRKSWVGELSLPSEHQQPLSLSSKPQGINHRNVTKPRDVKNRSSTSRATKALRIMVRKEEEEEEEVQFCPEASK